MKNIVERIEEALNMIRKSELRKNPEASAKAFEIREMIEELKTRNLLIQGALR